MRWGTKGSAQLCGPRHRHWCTNSRWERDWAVLLGSGWIWPAQSFMNMQLLPEAHNLEHGSWGDSEITWSEVHIVDRRKLRPSAEGAHRVSLLLLAFLLARAQLQPTGLLALSPSALSLPAPPSSCSGLALVAKPSWAKGDSFKRGLRKSPLRAKL